VWPDVAERVERDMGSPDPATRHAAARELPSLGAKRAGPLVLEALGDPDDDVRLVAADAAMRLRIAGATDAMVSWLNAADPRLRRKACEVAKALPNPRTVAPLSRTLGDADAEVRVAAADALGHQASDGTSPASPGRGRNLDDAVPPLLGRLDDPAPAVRIAIVNALARLGDPRAVVPLVGKVQDSAADVRQAVARALGDLGDPRASPALVLVLRDQNNDVRRDALTALGRMRAADAVDAIAPFATERTSALRTAALAALGRIASADAVRLLVGSLGTGEDASGTLERTPLRDALVAAGSRDTGAPLVIAAMRGALAGSSPPQVAASAAWVLGELHAKGEAPTIVTAMRRGALAVAAGLHALRGAGTVQEVPVVLEFVADPTAAVRTEAAAAASDLLDPEHPDGRAVEPLAAALRDAGTTAGEQVRLAGLLGRTGAPRAAPILVDLARAHDPAVALAAIDALGTLGPTGQGAVDDALLHLLSSADAPTRLHAAVALSEAAGARARDALLGQLEGGDEVDRAAVLTAMGGVIARVPTEAAVAKLAEALAVAAGPERDGAVEALGRAPLPSAVTALMEVSHSEEAADRRAAAVMAAAHADPSAVAMLRTLLADPDASVRAQAAWGLGSVGDESDVPRLLAAARQGDPDASTNAAAALARIAGRRHDGTSPASPGRGQNLPEGLSTALCGLLADARPYVRANALAGMAAGAIRCGSGGAPERVLLAEDPNEDVRAAAAAALATAPTPDDARALERCARGDPSGTVATRCRTPPLRPSCVDHGAAAGPSTCRHAHAALIYVVPEGASAPRPGAAYAMLLADGTIRAGTTDRRGAAFDPVAPEGTVRLRPASALAR
jgi:HEAT repeat protein